MQVKDEAPKLLKALEALKHPKEFAFHVGKDLIVNHADIFREVSASIDDYHAQKWEDFGKDTARPSPSSSLAPTKCLLPRTRCGRWC